MGHKSSRGAISITNCKGNIRLRWRHQGHRYSLNHSTFNPFNLLEAKKVALQIEQDIIMGCFDGYLVKYGARKREAGRAASFPETFVGQFEWLVKQYKYMDCEVHIIYNAFRNMIRKWGKVDEKNVLKKINTETFCATTFNRRLTILKNFLLWLIKMRVWSSNSLEDVQKKKEKRAKQEKRQPFTNEEISKILNAIKNDEACSSYSRYRHSHYYPFVYFIFKAGVRIAEAIGLRVKHLHLEKIWWRSVRC